MKHAAWLLALAFLAGEARAQCAPRTSDYQVPGATYTVCVRRDSLTIPSSTVSNAVDQWKSGCGSAFGNTAPNLVANPSNSLACDLDVGVTYSATMNPEYPTWDATFAWTGNNATTPPTLTGATIICHVNVCSAALLAHEIGHALGLGHAASSGCDGGIMLQENPGSSFDDACAQVAATWEGPNEPPPPEDGGGGQLHFDSGTYWFDPLVLDLNGDGIRTAGVDAPVMFDLDADGTLDRVTWLDPGSGDAFLWTDLNGNHRLDDGSELFGVGTVLPDGRKSRHGYEALALQDSDANGTIDTRDAVWNRLRLWRDDDQDGVCDPGESAPIHRYGVKEIRLQWITINTVDPQGGLHLLRGTYRKHLTGVGSANVVDRDVEALAFRKVEP